MIDLVLPENRFAYADSLMQMHHDRKRVFVDRLGWELPARGSWLEVDEFDNDHAVYLLARSASSGRHEGSVRLLPSTQPNIFASIFSSLSATGVPTGSDCWEISRLVTAPADANGTTILKVHRYLALALVEFAALNGIRYFSLVTEPHRVPALLSVGWEVRPLGLPSIVMGQELQALQIVINDDTLSLMRRKCHIHSPLLRSVVSNLRAA
jgi:N-acyl-L-homoserine lactone synthetase